MLFILDSDWIESVFCHCGCCCSRCVFGMWICLPHQFNFHSLNFQFWIHCKSEIECMLVIHSLCVCYFFILFGHCCSAFAYYFLLLLFLLIIFFTVLFVSSFYTYFCGLCYIMCEFEIRIGNEQIYTTYLDIWWLCCHYSLFIIVNSTRCAFFSVSLSLGCCCLLLVKSSLTRRHWWLLLREHFEQYIHCEWSVASHHFTCFYFLATFDFHSLIHSNRTMEKD